MGNNIMDDILGMFFGLILGVIIMCFIIMCFVAVDYHQDTCVDKGYAEFYINEDGDKDFKYFTIEEIVENYEKPNQKD